jgi:hypothetical protein
MPTAKKSTPKSADPKFKYSVGQRVFTIVYHKGKPEELLEGEIIDRVSREYTEKDHLGKKTGTGVCFTYLVRTSLECTSLYETEIYPAFVEAAKVFAKAFLVLLK